MQIMKTDGGPHPADKWADVTVQAILDLIQIDDGSSSAEAVAARAAKRNLRPVLFDILMAEYDCVQKDERTALVKEGCGRLESAFAIEDHIAEAIDSFTEALSITPFAEHFAKPEVMVVIRQIIGQNLHNVIYIERSWHADANPDAPETRAFRARKH